MSRPKFNIRYVPGLGGSHALALWCVILSLPAFAHVTYGAPTSDPFWRIQNVDATPGRVAEISDGLTVCAKGLTNYFPHPPEKMTVYAYGSRPSFVDGLTAELGFSKETAAFFAHSSAPRPINAKLLVPPDLKSQDVCYDVIYSYLESNTDKQQLLQAQWFEEGAVSFLSSRIFDERALSGIRERLQMSVRGVPGHGKFIPLEEMQSESDWRKLRQSAESRSIAYTQTPGMMQFFFQQYSPEQFKRILAKAKTTSFDNAFQQVTGIFTKKFYEDWLGSMGAPSFRPSRRR